MNTYYDNKKDNNSNNDILRDLLVGKSTVAPTWKRNTDGFLSLLAAMLSILTGSVARRILRAASFAVILLGMIALVGAVEAGTIGIGVGCLLGLPLLALEYLCLRKQ
jgi:hypothetical protein